MKQTRTKQAILAAAVLAGGMMESIEWSSDTGPPQQQLLHGDFTVSVSSAAAETRGPARRASCTLVRYYVARYTAVTAEAWGLQQGRDGRRDTDRPGLHQASANRVARPCH